ncbi:hypothetical protein FACS1894166_00820 [Bacilli bacterium]|nr:hypothetical protein FACS1894166_00820 [Bacilli bacterium]
MSYKEAIPETEPIAVTITATDGTTQQQTKIALLSPERIPEDAFHIKSVINDDCLVNDGEPIYTSSLDAGDPDHNVLLNLSKFKEVEHITTDDFVIDGIVNFGILVGFDENINLYGSSGSLMNITTTNVETYGIIVGSESPPEADHDSYTGKMYISHSVSCNISASATAYGV